MSQDDFVLLLQMDGVPVESCTVDKRAGSEKYDRIVVRNADGSVADSFLYDRSTGTVVEETSNAVKKISPGQCPARVDKEATVGKPVKRGRGRPRLAPYQSRANESSPKPSKTIRPIDSNEPHVLEVGDFVVAKDAYCADAPFPLYLVSLGNMLKRFEPIKRGDATLHEGSSRFSAYKDMNSLATSFRHVEVDVLTSRGKTPEVVKLTKESLPPKIDEELESSQLLHFFKVYVQCLLSQSMDSSFVDYAQSHGYFASSLEQIDYLLSECRRLVRSRVSWDEKVVDSLDRLPFFRVEELDQKDRRYNPQCEVTKNAPASRVLTLSGPKYDPKTLAKLSNSFERVAYLVSEQALGPMLAYHAGKHFKYETFLQSNDEVRYQTSKNSDSLSIVEGCLGNALWIQQTFKKLVQLAAKCGVEFDVTSQD